MRRQLGSVVGLLALLGAASTSVHAQAQPPVQLKLKAPIKIGAKPRLLATRFTSTQLVARLQMTTAGRQALTTAHVVSGGTTQSGAAADGWPETFAFTVSASQLTTSLTVGSKSTGVQLTHYGEIITSDGAGGFTVTMTTDVAPTPTTMLSVNALPAGWYAVAFELANISGSPGFIAEGGSLYNLLDPNNWQSQCAPSALAPDSNGKAACVVVAHLVQPVNSTTIIGAITAGQADLVGVTISRIGM